MSDEFVEVILGKLVEALRPSPFDKLDEPTFKWRLGPHQFNPTPIRDGSPDSSENRCNRLFGSALSAEIHPNSRRSFVLWKIVSLG
jgi:hypothetical protein